MSFVYLIIWEAAGLIVFSGKVFNENLWQTIKILIEVGIEIQSTVDLQHQQTSL